MSNMPTIPHKYMADFKMFRELTGMRLRDAVYAFSDAGYSLDKALTNYDLSQRSQP